MKKGFTLVELLAVIVILAIIALIVVPVVGNTITSARVAANARSVEGHIRNVELAIITKAFNEETGDLGLYDITNKSLPSSITTSLPANDSVTCKKYTIENGTVIRASGCKSNADNWKKKYGYTNLEGAKVTGDIGIEFEGKLLSGYSYDTYKGIVYMDPTDLSTPCAGHSDDIDVTSRETKDGCMKFYIFDDSGDKYKMILDRNIGDNVIYENVSTVLTNLAEDWVITPRLIEGDEIAHLLGLDLNGTVRWDSSKTYSTSGASWFYFDSGVKNTYKNGLQSTDYLVPSPSGSNYIWLFDYTNNCMRRGCGNNYDGTEGYWTGTPVTDNDGYYWSVVSGGTLSIRIDSSENVGIRPVIEVSKSLLTSEVENDDSFGGIKIDASEGETYKAIVYMDPTNVSNECDNSYNTNVTRRTVKEGCMKFYIYDDSGNDYKMMLDRNLTVNETFISKNDYIDKAISEGLTEDEANANWSDRKYNMYGPITINSSLSNKTGNWLGTVELISADEVAYIVGATGEGTIDWSSRKSYVAPINYDRDVDINTQMGSFYLDGGRWNNLMSYASGWSKKYANSTKKSIYAWLFDNVSSCGNNGCIYSIDSGFSTLRPVGYWTGTYVGDYEACYIYKDGNLTCSVNSSSSSAGLRPKFTISKSLID